ncbi:MAG: cell division protein ZapA [Flavobacteriales bacterium Tduv]
MQERIKINVLITDRHYPMTILRKEEPVVRRAAKDIGLAIKDIELKYAIRDKQDALSMCLLQYASKMGVDRGDRQKEEEHLNDNIRDIIRQIDEAL